MKILLSLFFFSYLTFIRTGFLYFLLRQNSGHVHTRQTCFRHICFKCLDAIYVINRRLNVSQRAICEEIK